MLALLGLVAGVLWFALATVVFRRCGPSLDGKSPRWTKWPGMLELVVFVVLGGWALGGAMVIQSGITIVSWLPK